MTDTIIDRVCRSKSVYPNRKRAAQAATSLRRRIREHGGVAEPIKAYHCEGCHGWHLGHPPGWREEMGRPRPAFRISL